MFHAMNYITACILVWKIEKVDRASAMSNVDSDVADLAKAVVALVETEELGDCSGSLGAEFAGRDVGWEGRSAPRVF